MGLSAGKRGYNRGMQNPKIIALLQTLFYGFFTVATPLFIESLGAGGAFYGWFSPTITGVLLFVLNLVDNRLNDKSGKSFFGAIS